MDRKIVVNGQEYASVNDMPADIRQLYEDAMRRLGGSGPDAPNIQVRTTLKTKIVVNGKEYNSLDELPPLLRERYVQALDRQLAQGPGVHANVTFVKTGPNRTTIAAIIVILLLVALVLFLAGRLVP